MPARPEDNLPPNSLRPRVRAVSRWAPLIIFGLSMTLTVGAYLHLRQESHLAQRAELARNGALIAKEIRERLHDHAQNLRGLRAFIAVRGSPSAEDWHAYMEQLDVERNVPGIQAYGYARKLTGDAKSPAGGSGVADAPSPAEDVSLPIVRISPDTPANRSALGFDLYSEEYRAAAIDTARDRDDLAITRRIELIQDAGRGGRQAGFLMMLPVYRSGAPIDNVEQRRAALSGVVYAAYRMNDFMHSLGYTGSDLGVRVYDAGPESVTDEALADTLLFDNAGDAWDSAAADDREMSFGARTWHLRFAPTARAGLDASEWVALFALIGGSLISLLLGLLSRMQAQSGARAEARAREMTRELRNSEERFQLVAAGTADGIWDRDLLRGTVWHSDRLKRILGFPPEVDTADVDFFMSRVHADDRPRLAAALERHLRSHQPYVAEYRFLRGDGELVWLSSRGQGVWDDTGRPVRMVGAITDISERKLAETRLDYYRAYLVTVLKFLPHPVFVKDRERRYITVSAAFCELVGKPEGEIIGRSDVGDQALPEDLARLARRMDERVLAGEGEQVAEYTLPLASGQRTVLVRKTLTNDPDGEPIIVGTLTDLTALRAAERERAAADLQRKVILDAATEVSIIATDTQGTIRLFNRGAEKMLGYKAEEIVDRQTPAIIHLRAEVEARGRFLSAELGEVVTGFDVFVTMPRRFGSESREWTYVRKDGSHLTVSLVVTTVRDEDGNVSGYLGVATDISERKSAEAELRRHRDHLQDLVDERTSDLLLAKEAAERANEAKSEFLANISHELRTPLHSILSFATLGGERAKGAQQDKLAHYFDRVQQSGSRLLALVNDLLELSKLEAGKMRIEPAPQDVAALIRDVAGEIEALAGERQVHIEILRPSIDTTVLIDGKRIGQVVRNVLSNAVKYSPAGGAVRVMFAEARLARGRRASDATEVAALSIEVRDEGVGIPESELETIFDKFVQSTRTNTGAGGTGLGLSISREIVLAHRGTIRACNNPDGGASFIVVLPRQAPPTH